MWCLLFQCCKSKQNNRNFNFCGYKGWRKLKTANINPHVFEANSQNFDDAKIFHLTVDSWLKAINEGDMVGCVLVDFRKAFDLVDHQILLKKLQCYKCNDSCLSWFESYLSNRTQRVSLNNNLSDAADVIYGVPQGSILGPLLFLIFINDLPLYIQSNSTSVDLYADDSYFYCSSHDKLVLERNLQASLDCLQRWCHENGIVLNTDKT